MYVPFIVIDVDKDFQQTTFAGQRTKIPNVNYNVSKIYNNIQILPQQWSKFYFTVQTTSIVLYLLTEYDGAQHLERALMRPRPP